MRFGMDPKRLEGQRHRRDDPDLHSRHVVRLFANWSPLALESRLTLGGGLNWQSASSTTIASPSGPAELRQSSVSLVSLMARYQFTPSLSLQLNANNVLDRKYYVPDQYDNTYYGAPASYSVTLRVAY
jgi:outer membrane receptor for ferric coprogen and ferric-rhodotorulic acid